jgi:N-alpha-acetyl-L-2,4-diaminobutyrate deacetylase
MHGSIEPIDHHKAGTQLKLEMVDRECFIPAPFAGHYEPLVDCGTRVTRGQTVGLLHDFDKIDDDPFPCVAALNGVVLAQAWAAPVPKGQHIVVVARERK